MSSHLPVSSGASAGSLKQVSNASDLVMYVAKWCNLAVLSSKSPPLFLRNDSEILMSRSSACSHDKLLQDFVFLFFRDKYISYYFPDVSNFCRDSLWEPNNTTQAFNVVATQALTKRSSGFCFWNKIHDSRGGERVKRKRKAKYSFKVFEDIRRYSCHIWRHVCSC